MKLRPILFSTPMVQALQLGIKTQTRRIIEKDSVINIFDVELGSLTNGRTRSHVLANFRANGQQTYFAGREAKYAIGDVLWVRETFFRGYPYLDDKPTDQLAYWYFADTRDARPGDVSDEWCINEFGRENKEMWPRWKPSIHMPFEAARLFLELTDIRVERLQDISEEDAIAEGIETKKHTVSDGGDCVDFEHEYRLYNTISQYDERPIMSYYTLWEKINGEGSWNQNPFVWVYTFKPVAKPIIK